MKEIALFILLVVIIILAAVHLANVYATDECNRYGWPSGRVTLEQGIMCQSGENTTPLSWLQEGKPFYE